MADINMTPPISDEDQENKLIALSYRQAQVQLEDGTASSQIVTHFLTLGTLKARLALEQAELQNRLLEEKIVSERSGQELNDMFNEVLVALKKYSNVPTGKGPEVLYANDL